MVTYLINGRKETFENEAQAQAYIKALGPGNDVELLTEGPPSDDKTTNDWETDGFATGEDENKVFPTDAAEGADVVSGPQTAQDTELTSEDGSLDLQTEDDYVKKLLKSPFHAKTKPEDFAVVEDYVTHEKQVKEIADNVQSESLDAINSALPNLKRTDYDSFDYTDVDLKEASIQATRNFIKNDDFINNELTPQIKEKLKPLTDNKIEEIRAKYKFDNPENATEENITKAEAEINKWYSEQFNNEMSADPAFKKRIEAFDLNKDVILGEDIKRFRSVNNDGNTVNILGFDTGIDAQRATDRAALFMLDLSKTNVRGSSMAKIALELFNVGRQIETSMSKAGTVGKLQMDMEKQNSFKRNQELANKNNWTEDTEGYWSVPNKDNTNSNLTYKFTPKYIKDLGYADKEGTTSKKGPNVVEGTWGEYKKAVAEVTQKDIQQFGKRIADLSEEELKESLVETKSWDRIKDGEGGLDDLLAVGLAQGSQVALAATPLGFMSSASQIGADIYYTKIEEEAKRRNNIENAEDLTPEMYAEVAADNEFTDKAINVAMSGGALAGALDKFGAGKTMKLFNNVSAKAILRGGAKDYFKRVANFSVENTKAGFIEAGTETLQEVVQAFASGTEVTPEQLFDAGGQAFISNLVFGGGGKAIQTTTKELKTAYSILSGKFNKNSSEAFFNQQLSDIDLAISKTEDKYEVETLQEKRKIIQEYRDANASIPKNVTTENRKKLVDNLVEERQIKDAIKEAGDILGPAIMEDQKPRLDALKIDNARILAEAKVAAVAGEIGGLNIRTASSQTEVDDIIEKMQSERRKKGLKEVDVSRDGYGFFYTSTDGKKNVVLNTAEIVKDGAVNTAAHEILHHAIDTLFKNSENKPAEMIKLSDELAKYTKSLSKTTDNEMLKSRLDQYTAKYEAKADMLEAEGDVAGAARKRAILAEEGLTLLSEAMLDGDIKFSESIVTKAKDLIRRLLSFAGVKAKIETGEDVFNFIKDYNRSIRKGKLSKGLKKTFAEGARGKGITKTNKSKPKKSDEVKESSKKMDRLVAQQEALTSMEGIMDAAELDIMKQENQQKIDELKTKEGIQTKTATTKGKDKGPMTLEEADEAYEDALEAWNEAPDNNALEAEVEKALKEVAAAKARFDEGMEAPVEVKAEDKSTAKPVREKKDRSTKRYTLTDQAKAKVEPLIAEAQAMNKELRAEEKKLNEARIASIRATPESEMSRTEQANAVLQAKANPIRLDKPVKLQRLETEIQDRLEKPLGKAVTFFTKLLYDKIPKEAANVIGGRDVYKSAAEARLISIVINEFKKNTVNRAGEKTTNDVEDIIFNRGGLRLLTLATDLGVADSKQGIAGAIDEGKVADYGDWDKAFDDSPVKMDVDGMFRVSSLLGDSGRMAQAMEQVAEFWKDNIGNSPIENFKKLPSLVDNIVAEMLNISENVLTARSGNLNKDDYTNALKGITKPYAVFKVEGKEIRVAPEFAAELENRLRNEGKSFERFADQNILQTLFKFLPKLSADDYRYADRTKGRYSGKATGVPKNLVKLTYSGLERGTTGMGNMKARVSKIAYKEVLAAMGGFVNPDGGVSKLANVSGKTPEGQTLLGVIKLMNRMITNDISRNSNMGLDPMTVQDIAAGKNDLMMSMKSNRNVGPIQVNDMQLQAVIDLFSGKNPKATYIQQIDNIHGVLQNMDSTIAGIFNYEVREYIKKNDPNSLADVSKAYDKSWGKTFKYVQEYISFKSAIDEISVNPSKAQLENFFVLYARALKNKQYEGAKNNTLLFDLVSKTVGPKVLKDLGFRLRKTDNMSFIEVKGENGNYETISSPLNIDTIKKLAKGEKLDPAKIKEIGDTMFDDAVRYTNLMINHIDRLVNSNQKLRAIADIHTMGLGQLTPIRKLSNLGTVYKFDGDGILEHAESVALIQEQLVKYAEGKINEAQLREYLGNQKVNIIPKEADPSQRVGTEKVKYSEAKVKKILDPLERETYDAAARRTELENKAKAENSNQAFNKAMDRTADTERKGISVLDFDDTLARTNSNVLYTMPNGKTGKLTAEQFAKDGDRMAAEGAEWDFSEFSQVIDGKKGPLFEKTKDLVAKFGNENVFILTARPANSKYAIHEFLSGLGLNIPLQNITGLADSNPKAKGDWITSKAAEGYNDFFFADDHIKNVMVVGQAMDEAGVKGKSILADPSVKYSLKIKRNYINQVTKGRPDLTAQQIDEQMYHVMEHVEILGNEGDFPPNKLAKYKKLGLHFLAKSPLILPEDSYKIDDVIKISEYKNIDPFKYNNPNDLINKFAGEIKKKRVNPDNVKEFSNKKELPKGVTVYDVENNKSGQEAVREVLDTHLGPKAFPWCAFTKKPQYTEEQDKKMEEYYATRKPINVLASFVVDKSGTGKDMQATYKNQHPHKWHDRLRSEDEIKELVDGGGRPGFILQDEYTTKELNPNTGLEEDVTTQYWLLLTDPKQTKEEFFREGVVLPPEPDVGPVKQVLDYFPFKQYGTADPDVKGSVGGWKIAFINGKLKSVKNLGSTEQKWWDLRDVATDDLKISKDGPGERTVMNIETGKTKKIPADPSMKWSMKRDKKLSKAIDDVVNLDRNSDSKIKGKASQPKYIKDLVDVFDMDGEGQTLLDQATRTLDLQWNMLYEDVTGVDADVEFNEVEAQKLGDEVSKGFKARFKSIMRGYLVESGADDFLGLLYRTLPKGKKGEAMMKLYEENLLKPFAIASREIEKARIKMAKRYRDIKVNNGISDKVLNGKVTLKTESGKDITYTSEDAVRVYMWRKQGIKVPGLSEQNELDLAEHVKQSDELYRFTLNLMAKTLPEEFADPSKNWVTGSLKTDYLEGINKAKRKEALRFWSKGIETIFSESNMNKLRVQHGTKYVAALQNSIERMKTGRNSTQSLDSDTKVMLQFIAGAVGNIMFLNTRSAGLQLLSATNFMAAGDNTWGKSLKTIFTKMPTLAKDYKMLMNTDFLLDRRNALKMDVNDSDIARIAEGKGLQGKLARFLQWGYVFTQAADSRAIALGGAVYYRNAYDKLIKQGVDPKVAKEQALLETTEHAQSSQQSSRADKISKQQASTGGRLMLAFANTPMQYNRLVQKAYLDLVNGRGSKGKNLYNIAYYGLAQNLLFTVAQGAMLTAVYGTLFGDDEEEDKLDYNKKVGIANGVLSSWLRGMGIWGNGLNALKQTFMNIHKESKKKRPEYDVAAIKGLTSIMPAVGSKISKIYATTKAIDYNKDFLFDVNEGNVFKNYAKMPGVIALGQTAALVNIPLDRAQRKIANLIDAVNYAQSDLTKTGGLLFGHSLWTLQSDEEKEADYEEQKARRKVIKKEIKETENKKDLSPGEIRRYDLKKLKKQEQIDILKELGLFTKEISKLKKEADRIEAIIKYQNIQKRKDSLK